MSADDHLRMWSEWVDAQIGGDSFRRRAAVGMQAAVIRCRL